MRTIIGLAVLLTFTACAAQQHARMQAEADRSRAACRAEFPAEIGNYVKERQCVNAAIIAAGFTGPSQALLNATALELAEKVDNREITHAEAEERYATLAYRINQQDAERRRANALAAATILGSIPQPQHYMQPVYQMPVAQPWTATCARMGDYTTCNEN